MFLKLLQIILLNSFLLNNRAILCIHFDFKTSAQYIITPK